MTFCYDLYVYKKLRVFHRIFSWFYYNSCLTWSAALIRFSCRVDAVLS